MHFRRPMVAFAACTALAVLSLAVPQRRADAQRQPGQNFGFYTTTGLRTFDLEGGSVNSTSEFAEAPSVAVSGLLTTRLVQRRKSAWIVGVRGTVLSLGNSDRCVDESATPGCQDRRFTERVSFLTGGAVDIRSTILRAMVGPALYSVQGSGLRVGTQLRIDYAAPRLNGLTPTLFFSSSLLGNQRGRAANISTLGVGFRWVRRR
ncbi:hypothetical protein [Gemmatimonas sp.]|uniref:hypothetical protein n=1 Tax=Gemmatimonas sp. TaxID=1962908 RepID=UPI0035631289